METRKVNVMGKEVQIPKGMTFGELAKEFEGEVFGKILVAKQGNSLRELICPIRTDEDITFLDFRDKEGVRVYERGISLLLVKAVRDVLGTATGVEIEHSLRGNLYCELSSLQQMPDADLLAKIEARMKEYVAADTPIVKHVCPREVAISIVKEQGLQDKVELFRYRTASNINLYELDGFYDYFFGYMPDSKDRGASAGGAAQKNQQGISGADALVPADAGAERGGAEPHDCRGEIRRPDSRE